MFLKTLNNDEKNAFYYLADSLVKADRRIAENEELLMNQFLEEMGISIEEVKDLSEEDAIKVFLQDDKRVRKQIFIELLALGLSDNALADEETELMSKYADSLEISLSEFNDLKKCVMDLVSVYNQMYKLIEK